MTQVVSLETWVEQIMIRKDESNEKVREKCLCHVSEDTAQNRQKLKKKKRKRKQKNMDPVCFGH